MALEELILCENILFDINGKLREGGKKFLNHISNYSEKVVLLGYKQAYAEELLFYIAKHLKNANLKLIPNSQLGEYLVEIEELNPNSFLFIATSDEELKEAKEWRINAIFFGEKQKNREIPSFKELKEITRYISTLK